jgi:hypothetical protein
MEPRGREQHRWANREVEWSFWKSDIEGKTEREAASELGKERVSSEREHMSQSWEANEFQAATGTEAIAWAVQRHVDFTDCKTSLSHHG